MQVPPTVAFLHALYQRTLSWIKHRDSLGFRFISEDLVFTKDGINPGYPHPRTKKYILNKLTRAGFVLDLNWITWPDGFAIPEPTQPTPQAS